MGYVVARRASGPDRVPPDHRLRPGARDEGGGKGGVRVGFQGEETGSFVPPFARFLTFRPRPSLPSPDGHVVERRDHGRVVRPRDPGAPRVAATEPGPRGADAARALPRAERER